MVATQILLQYLLLLFQQFEMTLLSPLIKSLSTIGAANGATFPSHGALWNLPVYLPGSPLSFLQGFEHKFDIYGPEFKAKVAKSTQNSRHSDQSSRPS